MITLIQVENRLQSKSGSRATRQKSVTVVQARYVGMVYSAGEKMEESGQIQVNFGGRIDWTLIGYER